MAGRVATLATEPRLAIRPEVQTVASGARRVAVEGRLRGLGGCLGELIEDAHCWWCSFWEVLEAIGATLKIELLAGRGHFRRKSVELLVNS